MARFDADPLQFRPALSDGPARCRVCATTAADAEHEWCPAAEALVCEECCRRILLGSVGAYIAAAVGAGSDPTPSACADCERGQRWFAGQVLGALGTGERAN